MSSTKRTSWHRGPTVTWAVLATILCVTATSLGLAQWVRADRAAASAARSEDSDRAAIALAAASKASATDVTGARNALQRRVTELEADLLEAQGSAGDRTEVNARLTALAADARIVAAGVRSCRDSTIAVAGLFLGATHGVQFAPQQSDAYAEALRSFCDSQSAAADTLAAQLSELAGTENTPAPSPAGPKPPTVLTPATTTPPAPPGP